MPQIIPVSAILPVRNNRENFSHVPGLADSIVSTAQSLGYESIADYHNGLQSAITIIRLPDNDARYKQPVEFCFTTGGEKREITLFPEYTLIAGESRWRAHIFASLPVIKAEIADSVPNEVTALMGTILENVARKDLTPIEESNGFNRLAEFGKTPDEIARSVGKKTDYVTKRMSLKNLTPEYADMVHKSQLTIDYAVPLATLKPEYQYQAMTELVNAGDKVTVAWFRKICGKLLEKQNTCSLFDLALFGGTGTTAPPVISPTLTPANMGKSSAINPFTFTLTFSADVSFTESLQSAIDTLAHSKLVWQEFEHIDKVALCDNLVAQYQAILANMPQKDKPEDKIKKLLTANPSGMTRREMAQYANMTVTQVIDCLNSLPVICSNIGKKQVYFLS